MNRFMSIILGGLQVVLPAGSLFMTGIFRRELMLFVVALCALLFLVIGCVKRFWDNRPEVVATKLDFVLAIFVIYAVVRGAFQGFEQIDPLVWIQLGAIVSVYMVVRMLGKKKVIFSALLISTSVQSLVAMGQKVGWCRSLHSQFEVTGTFGNPGQLGGFVAIGCIIALAMVVESVKFRNKPLILLYSFILSLNMVGLYLSDSRAGWVAFLMGGVVFLWKHIQWRLRGRKGVFLVVFLLFTAVFLILISGYRPASVLARILIYTNTLSMGGQSPLFGLGFGSFEKGYMLEQANYFVENPNSMFVSVADNVAYPYNELLHLFVVFGVVGVVLVLLMIRLIFKRESFDFNDRTIKASLVVWIVFSMFSYPSYVCVLSITFVVLLALLDSEPLFILKREHWRDFVLILFLLFASVVCVKEYLYFRNLSRKTLFEECNIRKLRNNALYSLQLVAYWSTDHTKFDRRWESSIVPSSENYCDLGDIYAGQKEYEKAERYYKLSAAMIPTRLRPNYSLWLLYLNQNDTVCAIGVAKQILKQPLKVEGTYILRSKAEVREWLRNLNHATRNKR